MIDYTKEFNAMTISELQDTIKTLVKYASSPKSLPAVAAAARAQQVRAESILSFKLELAKLQQIRISESKG
jgi:hypothetical protein